MGLGKRSFRKSCGMQSAMTLCASTYARGRPVPGHGWSVLRCSIGSEWPIPYVRALTVATWRCTMTGTVELRTLCSRKSRNLRSDSGPLRPR